MHKQFKKKKIMPKIKFRLPDIHYNNSNSILWWIISEKNIPEEFYIFVIFFAITAHTAPKYLENIVRLPKYFETYH